jgi:hypothetical protein
MSEATSVKCWIVHETEKALLVSKTPPERGTENTVWIPRSMIEHSTKHPPLSNGWRPAIIKMEEWVAEDKGLI